eukprot:scaffold18.g1923.t1
MGSPEASPPPEIKLFERASQPTIIRAQQKVCVRGAGVDELYQQYLVDACHDVVRRLLGPRAALAWARETKALAGLLYLGFTTGAGSQTLGEEYCDILQVTGALGGRPVAARRGALVLLQALGPYLADRLAATQQDDDLAAWQAGLWQQQQQQRQQQQQEQQGEEPPLWRRALVAAQATARHAGEAASGAALTAARHFPRATVLLQEHWASLLRLHLALFYLYGTYYQPSKRATGVRYLFLGRAFEGRPSYHALGVLLCLQLAASAGAWALRSAGGLVGAGGAAGTQVAKPGRAVLLAEDGSEVAEEDARGGSGAAAGVDAGSEVPLSRKCPLCLSARVCPTATPCGHVFCWQCVAECMCFVEALGPLFSCDSALGELYGSLGSLLLACKGARNAVAAMVNKRSARFVAAAELMRSAEGREELAQLIRRLHPHLTVRVQPTGELHPSLSWLANGPLGRAFALRREMLDWGRRLEARDPWASAEVQGSAATLLVLPDGLLAPGFKELSRVAGHSP